MQAMLYVQAEIPPREFRSAIDVLSRSVLLHLQKKKKNGEYSNGEHSIIFSGSDLPLEMV